ncbi:hypothetical protein F5Y19DRAFT_118763 [Xylariaceae sp. FL1651]|nr:hypothetical protein F5Y19DRAFT_118763 [Xylariaceae sp. FL1651]
MALGKWRFSSSRKHSATSLSNSGTTTGMTTPTDSTHELSSSSNMSSPSSPLSPSSPSQSRFSWFKSSPRSSPLPSKKSISRDDPAFARLHKPFTAQNLEHQKLLNAFEWNFGRQRRPSHGARSYISSISPSASRSASIDYGYEFGYDQTLSPNDPQDT